VEGSDPPDAAGLRLDWPEVPGRVRAAVEDWLGSHVVSATSQSGGFSPGVSARLETQDGHRVFVKAAGLESNPQTPMAHRWEAKVAAALPKEVPMPRLLWSCDEGEGGWVVLVFQDVDGRNPTIPWQTKELDQTLRALVALSEFLTPSPLAPGAVVGRAEEWSVVAGRHWEKVAEEHQASLDAWSARHLEGLADLEVDAPLAVAGDTLLHLDVRADNLLLTPEGQVLVVDWPHVRVGAP
jgi:aminoglycoside phosphotransferase (APT) family kinase protein